MACHSQRFFAEAEAQGESPVGWHQTGSLGLARSAEHWEQLQRGVELLKDAGVLHEVYHVLADPADAAAVRAIHPLLDLAGVHGAIHTPTDGIVNPVDSCMAVVRAARCAGARFVEQCGVAQLNTAALESGGVSGSGGGIDAVRDVATVHAVTTTGGERVACGAVLLACGSWTRHLAAQLGVVVPTAIVPHQYAVFDRVAGVSNKLPVVRDYQKKIYIKPEVGGLAVGAFENPHTDMPSLVAARNAAGGDVPADAHGELYDESIAKLENGLEAALELVPALAQAGIKQWVHGPDTHSVDHEPILGRAAFTHNLYVATGFNSQGIQTGPGVGQAMASWVLHGDPSVAFPGIDFSGCDVRRFHPASVAAPTWGTARALEGYAKEYGLHPPHEQWEAGRGVRLSPLHERIAAAGALFGSVGSAGWERPLHFPARNAGSEHGSRPLYEDEALSFDRMRCGWVEPAAAEHRACREGVGLFDLSSFGKVLVSGPRAAALLEWAASSPIGAAPDGRVLYTQMLNARGGIESDLTMVPLPPTDPLLQLSRGGSGGEGGRAFYLVTAGATCTRDTDHLQRMAAQLELSAGDVELRDVTDEFAVLALSGPESRVLLQQLWVPTIGDGTAAEGALSDDAFPFGTMQHGSLRLPGGGGGADIECRALRISFAGELGWELHVPRSGAPAVFDALHAAATAASCNGGHGLVNCGYRALLESLRLEKGYVHFGHDVSPVDTQLEAGLGFVSAAKLKAATPFCGREALEAQKAAGITRRLVSFALGEADAAVSLWGHEGIWRDGIRIGQLTSGGIGHSVNGGRAIGMGYVESPGGGRVTKRHVAEGGYELEVAGRRVPAAVSWSALS